MKMLFNYLITKFAEDTTIDKSERLGNNKQISKKICDFSTWSDRWKIQT